MHARITTQALVLSRQLSWQSNRHVIQRSMVHAPSRVVPTITCHYVSTQSYMLTLFGIVSYLCLNYESRDLPVIFKKSGQQQALRCRGIKFISWSQSHGRHSTELSMRMSRIQRAIILLTCAELIFFGELTFCTIRAISTCEIFQAAH